MEARVPVSMSMSFALHFGGLTGWLYLQQATAQTQLRFIPGVEIVRVNRPLPAQPLPKRALPKLTSMKDFLKMALPSVPKAAPLEVKEPELVPKKALADVPEKIKDMGRIKKNLLDDKLVDLGRTRKLASLDAGQVEASRARKALAELPKLDIAEVGARRASKAKIEMAALVEEKRGRLQAVADEAPPEPKAPARRIAELAAPLEDKAPPRKPAPPSKMADMLTSDAPPLPRAQPMEPRLQRKETMETPELSTRKAAPQLATTRKKSMEIEGPLADRKVAYYEVPQFPQWAVDQGIPEADVRIRFYVAASGEVLASGLRIEQTSGYGRLDRLAMEVLRRWRFEPAAEGTGNQWGIITFRFVLN